MVALLLLLVGLFVTSGTSEVQTGVTNVQATRVPNVTGLTVVRAMRRVRRAGLVATQTRCAASATVWSVKSQRPTAGRMVPRGSRVQLRLVPAQRHTPCNAYSGPLP